MRKLLLLGVIAAAPASFAVPTFAADYPEPSIYQVSWQLDFKHGTPSRIVVDSVPYWYMTYTVTNNTGQEQIWRPDFEMLDNDGKVLQSDRDIPPEVFDQIKRREHGRFMQTAAEIAGPLHQGEDQARDGVAIWKEPDPRMGHFQIFVGGLSGEFVPLKDSKGKPVMGPDNLPVFLHKELELRYAVYGDEFFPERHTVHDLGQTWVMR